MSKMFLKLLIIVTFAIGNWHSPAMLHAEEAEHIHHVETADFDHDQTVGNPAREIERGTLTYDHHGPTAMTVVSSLIEAPLKLASNRYPFVEASALRSWPTAPPPEPPSA